MKAIVLDMYGVIVMKPILLNSRNVEYEGTSVKGFDELANVLSALDLRG